MKTLDDRIEGQRTGKSRPGIHRRRGDVRQSGHADYLQIREPSIDGLDAFGHFGEIDFLRRGAYILKLLGRILELKRLLEFLQSRHGGLNVLFKILVVESHLDNALIYFLAAHSLVTSLHASLAILSKTG